MSNEILFNSTTDNRNTGLNEVIVPQSPNAMETEDVAVPPRSRQEKFNAGSIDDLPKEKRAKMTKKAGENPHTKEVWFPGTHSDV